MRRIFHLLSGLDLRILLIMPACLIFLFAFISKVNAVPPDSCSNYSGHDNVDPIGGPCNAGDLTFGTTQTGKCYQFLYQQPNGFQYTVYASYVNITEHYPITYCPAAYSGSYGQFRRTEPPQYIIGCWVVNGGYFPCGTNRPTPTGESIPPPPGGTCDNPTGKANGLGCPAEWIGRNCSRVPCAYRGIGKCDTCPACCPPGGGPPTATPTPYCTLTCPGARSVVDGSQQINIGSRGGPIGTNNGADSQSFITPIQPPVVTGNIVYQGYNNYICGTFEDGLGYNGPCPPSAGSNSFTYPVRYHMLCGGQAINYTSIVNDGRLYGFTNGDLVPPEDLTPTPGQYVPGCVFGSPYPTNRFPTSSDLSQWRGGTDGANVCACEVALGCQTKLYPIESSPLCTPGSCDVQIVPDNPTFNEEVTFNLDGPQLDSIDFDDGTDPILNPGSSVTHTFANAGVYDVKLTCLGGAQVCTKTMNAYCYTIPKLWYKLKDASINKFNTLNNPIPDPVIKYDNDDTATRVLIGGDGGIAAAEYGVNVGTGSASLRDWQLEQYRITNRLTPQTFLDYVKARKKYVAVVTPDNLISSNEVSTGVINIIQGNYTLDSASIQSNAPFVLIVDGDVSINGNINPPTKSVAIIATGKLMITSNVTEVNGLFVANSMDFASDIGVGNTTPNTLKIAGNIISEQSVDMTKRQGTDISRPSIFMIFKPGMYDDLLPMLSVRSYQWSQLTP